MPIHNYTVRVCRREPRSTREPGRKRGVELGSGFNVAVRASSKRDAHRRAYLEFPVTDYLAGRVWGPK